MRIHILGIGGTFMSGLAILAKQSGHEVTGSDVNVYPPMSTQLEQQGILLMEGYEPAHIRSDIERVIIGNVIKRGNPALEYILSNNIPYTSGPQWLSENILKNRWVLAVAGTHGKTTTTSLLTWILEYAGFKPGFLIGGIPENFGVSSRLGSEPYFVIEADEYDSAFFDKRSKFIHYHPKTLVLNNLEYDHADIFPDLAAIQREFHYLIRTIPGNGLILNHDDDLNLKETLGKGCWSETDTFGGSGSWQAELKATDGSEFKVFHHRKAIGEVHWDLLGGHNVSNALAAIAAAHHVKVPLDEALNALSSFKNVKRRMEVKGKVNDIVVYDDFAHHPTAIATTLKGLRAKIGKERRLIAVLEFASYTMRSGVHKEKMQAALIDADVVVCKDTESPWGLKSLLSQFSQPTLIYDNVDALVTGLVPRLQAGDHIIVMSNSGFGGIHKKLLNAIGDR